MKILHILLGIGMLSCLSGCYEISNSIEASGSATVLRSFFSDGNQVAFSADGDFLLTNFSFRLSGNNNPQGKEEAASLWRVSDLTKQREFDVVHEVSILADDEGVLYAILSPDGESVAAVVKYLRNGFEERHAIIVWELATGRQLHRRNFERTDRVAAIAYAPDGETIAATGNFEHILLWKPQGSPRTREIEASRSLFDEHSRLEFNSGGDLLLVNSRELYSLTSESRSNTDLDKDHPADLCRFTPDGERLICGGTAVVTLLDARSGRRLGTVVENDDYDVTAIAISKSGAYFATAHFGDQFSDDRGSDIRVWDIETAELVARIPGSGRDVAALDFSPNGELLVAGENGGETTIFRITYNQ